ncbi:RHS repeat domain-containing protein [Congregicoccus parvus]|uniref:RHS repeat domain-containing protein n=1 Tax=Congregicoccus parvus TaxID=3081749 RepID=UPI003FA59579
MVSLVLAAAATGLLKEKRYADHVDTTNPRRTTYTYSPLRMVATREWSRLVPAGLPNAGQRVKTTYGWSTGTSGTGEPTSVTHNDDTPGSTFTYRRSGLSWQTTDVTGTRTYVYRSDLQLDREELPSGFFGASRTLTSVYETGGTGTVNGRGKGVEFKTGSTIEAANTFAFEASTGRISSVAGASGAPGFTYGYTAGSDWASTVTSGSYLRTNTLLTDRHVLDKVETKWGSTVKGLYDSTFDSRGQRSTVAQSGEVVGTANTHTYTYNDRGELTASNNSLSLWRSYSWGYDLMGKRTSAYSQLPGTWTYTASSDAAKDVNQYASITGESGLAYDADGNLAQDGTWHYRYDAENRLREMERKNGTQTLQFLYDHAGRRVRKTVRNGTPAAAVASSTKFVWAGWKLLSELDAGTAQTGSTVAKSYVWGSDFGNASGAAGGAGGLLSVKQGGAWYHVVYDHMGNVTGYLNTSGTVVAKYEYNAYGQIVSQSGSSTSFAFGHATQYTDHESGLVYYGLRYYQPKHGRFINRDPIEESGGLNLYSFVGNSPTNRWDVLGLCEQYCWLNAVVDGESGVVYFEEECAWVCDPIEDDDGPIDDEPIDGTPIGPAPVEPPGAPVAQQRAGSRFSPNLDVRSDWRKFDPIEKARAANSENRRTEGRGIIAIAGAIALSDGPAPGPADAAVVLGAGAGAIVVVAASSGAMMEITADIMYRRPYRPLGIDGRVPQMGDIVPIVVDALPIAKGITPQDVGIPPVGPNGVPVGWIPSPADPGVYIPPAGAPPIGAGPNVPTAHPDAAHPVVPGIPGPHTDVMLPDGSRFRVYPNGDVQPVNSGARKKVQDAARRTQQPGSQPQSP